VFAASGAIIMSTSRPSGPTIETFGSQAFCESAHQINTLVV
jgi:hypothetical protein